MHRTATAELHVYWNDRSKSWHIVARNNRTGARVVKKAQTTSEVMTPELHLLAEAMRREMESWLA